MQLFHKHLKRRRDDATVEVFAGGTAREEKGYLRSSLLL